MRIAADPLAGSGLRGALKLAPEPFAGELAQWIEHGAIPDNDLLWAIIRNDLGATIAFCPHNIAATGLVHATWSWLHNFADPRSFGSPMLVERWRNGGGAATRARP